MSCFDDTYAPYRNSWNFTTSNPTYNHKALFVFQQHSLKVIDTDELEKWQKDIFVTLSELEMHFPPSFFDVMVHLISHIVKEIKACGPVFQRYMYPFERFMGFLKGHVRNRHRPEGSIVEGYTSEEVIDFCQGNQIILKLTAPNYPKATTYLTY